MNQITDEQMLSQMRVKVNKIIESAKIREGQKLKRRCVKCASKRTRIIEFNFIKRCECLVCGEMMTE